MTDIRCVKCSLLLFRGIDFYGSIEVKCNKCGYVQVVRGKKLYPTAEDYRKRKELEQKFGLTY